MFWTTAQSTFAYTSLARLQLPRNRPGKLFARMLVHGQLKKQADRIPINLDDGWTKMLSEHDFRDALNARSKADETEAVAHIVPPDAIYDEPHTGAPPTIETENEN